MADAVASLRSRIFGSTIGLAAEGEQLRGQGGGPFTGIAHLSQRLAPGRHWRLVVEQQRGVAVDHREQVVEVVGDAARQLSDRLHLLRLPDLLAEPALFGDVPSEGVDGLLCRERNRAPREPTVGAILGAIAVHESVDALTAAQLVSDNPGRLDVVGMNERQPGLCLQFLGRPSQALCPRRVEVMEVAIETGDAHRVGRVVPEIVSLFLCSLAVGDVCRDAADRVGVAVAAKQRKLRREHRDLAPVPGGARLLDLTRPQGLAHDPVVALELVGHFRRHEFPCGAAHPVVVRQAEQLHDLPIHELVASVEILQVDERGRGIEHVPEALFAVAYGLLHEPGLDCRERQVRGAGNGEGMRRAIDVGVGAA